MRVISTAHCRSNQNRLALAVLADTEVPSDDAEAYREAVSRLRGYPTGRGSGISVEFDESSLASYAFKQGLFPEKQGEVVGRAQDQGRLNQLLRDGMSLVRASSPELYELISIVTTDIVFVDSSRIGGGSGSHLPGLIAITPGNAWEPLDIAKCLVHEATHLSTFLCDMVFGIFTEPADLLERQECRVLSAVRVGEMRPLDKALHSALVAVPVLYLEHLVGESQVHDEFMPSILACTEGLLTKSKFLTPYGRMVVEDLRTFVADLNYDAVLDSLRSSDQECLAGLAQTGA